ncbi:LytR/AlgR family response regulator transcription factor [Arcicella rigui]|uniref:LytTR family DNA-binding domain-containing protein n=1 Tax=Arcicella rigui TaxID=797020 RepID=A0ABU5QE03_9BACT|nr:LytTR family DNA-binding domain-containing protein [Arcicella rigui]MEA5141078.1 LytTR family DNA-binding domain-containing protein [Arcicella rigui]
MKSLRFKGFGNYIKIHTENATPLVVLEKLSNIEEKLPQQQFIRTHKSYIVNITHIKQVEGNMIKCADKIIPISGSYRQNFEAFIQRKIS